MLKSSRGVEDTWHYQPDGTIVLVMIQAPAVERQGESTPRIYFKRALKKDPAGF